MRTGACITVLAALLAASCAPNATSKNSIQGAVGDGGLVSGDPCGPPCFWNITPGRSSMDDAIEQLRIHGIYDQCETQDSNDDQFIFISCGLAVSIVFERGSPLVRSVSFSPSAPIALKDAISAIGPPACILVLSPLLPDHPATYAHLEFGSPPATIYLAPQDAMSFKAAAESVVTHVVYRAGSSLANEFACQPWTGYGEYHPQSGS